MRLDLSWTDECFLFVLLLSIILIINSLKKEHVRMAFRQIFSRPVAMSAAIVLSFFLVIGILDSLHFRTHSAFSYSLLDYLLSPLDKTYEQSYSKPLALHLYAKEIVLVHNKPQQIYPALTYSHSLHTETQKIHFIAMTILKATVCSFIILFCGGILFIIGRRCFRWLIRNQSGFQQYRPTTKIKLTVLLTYFCCLWLLICCYQLSRELHVLGTGQIGQDIFYYTIKSIRTGLIIGILTTLFMMPLALFAGIAAGYFGGIMDDIIQYIYTTLSSIPGVLLISASVLSMQTYIANHPEHFATLAQSADARLLALCLILGVTSWTSLCRLLRAETLKLREIDFVLAAQALGSHAFKIMLKHILPNVMHIVVITIVLDFSFLVLAEAVLSYVGVGVSPMTISWGNMINAARLELAREPIVWWPMASAFLFMFLLVLASNLFADAVRDAFDPRQEQY